MSYQTISDGVIVTIRGNADYSTTNVFADDYRHLGAGQDRYVVVSAGGMTREEVTFTHYTHNWTVNLDIFTRYTGQLSVTHTNAHTDAQNIIDTLESQPRLSDTTGVESFEIGPLSTIEPPSPDNHAGFVRQQLSLSVSENVIPTRNE